MEYAFIGTLHFLRGKILLVFLLGSTENKPALPESVRSHFATCTILREFSTDLIFNNSFFSSNVVMPSLNNIVKYDFVVNYDLLGKQRGLSS